MHCMAFNQGFRYHVQPTAAMSQAEPGTQARAQDQLHEASSFKQTGASFTLSAAARCTPIAVFAVPTTAAPSGKGACP